MVDSFLANVEADEQVSISSSILRRKMTYYTPYSLRAIVRATLASCPPTAATAFTAAARKRLARTNARAGLPPGALFGRLDSGLAMPAEALETTLRHSRSLYGAGMGFASLGVLTAVVKATIGLQWDMDGTMADALVAVDADISQAIQSAKEEIAAGRVLDISTARAAVNELAENIGESLKDTERWGGEFPFEQAQASIRYWKL